ncbi:MAG: aldehyde dehydrogenase family protein [Bacteriovoracaceae bacterium]|nr:aldehyde dehydrogenase family protein [Bacteriovoracaceae bacterium]
MTPLAIRGLKKAGDILIPGDDKFPRFSQTDLYVALPRMMDDMYKDDREGFILLTSAFGLMPSFMIRLILWVSSLDHLFPKFIASILRQIYIGVRGVIFTLYYSGIDQQGILDHLGFHSQINTKLPQDIEMQELLASAHPLKRPVMLGESQVIEKARVAQKEIAQLDVSTRLKAIKRLKRVILARQEEIVEWIQKETQKARTDVLTSEIFGIMEHLEFLEKHVEAAIKDETAPTPVAMMGKKSKIYYEPMGVILIISPWNYPFYQAIVPITCAFVTGNACVYKPSELTPLQGLVESVLTEAGIAPSWAQVVYGDGKVAQELIAQKPNKIFFTGSVGTGKKIMAQASEYLIPVELELGGKDPMIVFKEAHMNRAVAGAIWGAFTNSGQSCTSVERLYVESSIYEEFKKELLAKVQTVKIGVDTDGDADMGKMISPKQVKIVADLVKDALSQGAVMLTGQEWDFHSDTIPPIVLEGTTHGMRINQEEIFGPVLPLMRFNSEDEAIELANDSAFGLSASVWGKGDQCERVARKLITGNVSINNVMISEGNHALPFGGVKDSGIGRYKGVMGLRSFCNVKSVLIDGNSKKIEANWYPYTPKKYRLFTDLTQALFKKKWIGFALSGLKLESYSQKAKRP